MTEKTMVADTLAGINGELVRYGEMITQTENQQLKHLLFPVIFYYRTWKN